MIDLVNERQEQRRWGTLRWMMLTPPSLLSSQPLPRSFSAPSLAAAGYQGALAASAAVSKSAGATLPPYTPPPYQPPPLVFAAVRSGAVYE